MNIFSLSSATLMYSLSINQVSFDSFKQLTNIDFSTLKKTKKYQLKYGNKNIQKNLQIFCNVNSSLLTKKQKF